MLPIVGITMGDPAGIGPEILLKTVRDSCGWGKAYIVAVADILVLNEIKEKLNIDVELLPIRTISRDMLLGLKENQLAVIDISKSGSGDKIEYGKIRAEYGMSAYTCILTAIELAKAGSIDAVVTNPISKEALHRANIDPTNHTEIFAARTGIKSYAMMLVHEPLRVVHVSTHVSLREACDRVKKERILDVIRLTADAVRRIESNPRPIAVAGLNPHAGENGLFGIEEKAEIMPAIENATNCGINVAGPFPPDTIFSRAMGGEYSAVIAMYHDQGHIPVKMAGFRIDSVTGRHMKVSGINVTLGLPIIRVSVDHGTAFDIAGKGIADHRSLFQAVEYAVKMYENGYR